MLGVRDLLPGDGDPGPPPELLILDREERCPYYAERRARLPLRLPSRPLTGSELDARLAAGDRRWGRFLYRPSCPHCRACEPIRVDVERFRPSRNLRRAARRAAAELKVELGPLIVDDHRIRLFEKHKLERKLSQEPSLTEEQYGQFLVDRCCQAFEIRLYHRGRLCGVAITDRGERALSAVYTYYDPGLGSLSPGTFAILTQISLARRWEMSYLYLGLFIEGHPHMSYKARFRPHQRLIDGRWRSLS